MPRKPKPGDRVEVTAGAHKGRVGVYKRDTDNGKSTMGYVLLIGDTTGERRLWISSMKVLKTTDKSTKDAAKLAIELLGLTIG